LAACRRRTWTKRRPRELVDQLGGNLVQEPRRLRGLIVAEHAAPGRGRQHDLAFGPRQADVAQTPLLLELGVVVHGPRMREQTLLEAADDDGRELQPLGAVHRHHQDVAVTRAGLLVGIGQQRQLIDETRQRRLRRSRLELPAPRIPAP
jgi:hypothetical protein